MWVLCNVKVHSILGLLQQYSARTACSVEAMTETVFMQKLHRLAARDGWMDPFIVSSDCTVPSFSLVFGIV